MGPRIENIASKQLIGNRLTMSMTKNRTRELWQSFVERRAEIKNSVGTTLYSLQVYDTDYFKNFNPDAMFEKWALAEVSDFNTIPDEMNTFTLSGGMYAVFMYKGLNTDNQIFQFIYGIWLPNSEYVLDNRPHFETLGEKYKNNDPNSEEEIWVPVKLK